jgi:hypothetical protein
MRVDMFMRPLAVVVLAAVGFAAAASSAAAIPTGTTVLIDRPSGVGTLPFDGLAGALATTQDVVSDDGRYVAFESDSDGILAAGASRVERHVFVRDRQTGTTTQVDRAQDGTAGNGYANSPAISGDGHRVAFFSSSTNLNGDSVNDTGNVFVKDLVSGVVYLASRRTGAAGTAANGFVSHPALSFDGDKVAFAASVSLDAADTNNLSDVYSRAIGAGETTLVSRLGAAGAVGNGASAAPSINAAGDIIAFESHASNLSPFDGDAASDVFVRANNAIVLASRLNGAATTAGNGESYSPSLDASGTKVAFYSSSSDLVADDIGGFYDVFVRDTTADTTMLMSRPDGSTTTQADASSDSPVMSSDGSLVAFSSSARNLATVSDASFNNVFTRTLTGSTTTLISRETGAGGAPIVTGGSSPGLSANGSIVSFGADDASLSADSPQIRVRDTTAGTTETVSAPSGLVGGTLAGGASVQPQGVSGDGRFVVFSSQADGLSDADDDRYANAYLRDTLNDTTTVLTGSANGDTETAGISTDGSTIFINTFADNLPGNPADGGVYVIDRVSGAKTLVSRADGANGASAAVGETGAAISADGKLVAFETGTALDPAHDTNNASDIYVRNVAAGTTVLASRADGSGTNAGNAFASTPSINADGTRVAFSTNATDLGDGDANAITDIHVRDLSTGVTILASRATGTAGANGNHASSSASISPDGTRVVFASLADNFGDADTTSVQDIHMRNLGTGATTLVSRVGLTGNVANGRSDYPTFSRDGTRVGFITAAASLTGSASGVAEAVVRTFATGVTEVVSRADGADGSLATRDTFQLALDNDGGCAAFGTTSPGLTSGDYASPDYIHVHLRAVSHACPAPAPITPDPDPTPDPTPTPTPTPAAGAKPVPRPSGTARPRTDTVAPVIIEAKLNRKTFTVGKRPTAVSAVVGDGAKVNYALSEAATVSFFVVRAQPGLLKGKLCVAPTAKLRKAKAKKCTRTVLVGTLKRKVSAGAQTLVFTGRIGKKPLRPASYQMVLSAADAAGNRSKTRTLKFKVVRR